MTGVSVKVAIVLVSVFLLVSGCDNKKDSDSESPGQSYSFTSAGNAKLTFSSSFMPTDYLSAEDLNSPLVIASGPTLCSSVICFSATALTGKYYGLGFSIQSAGNGMVAYFGQDSWSGIVGTSTTYNFDASNPVVNSGTLVCCNGTGDLSSSNTYIESVMYLFSYLDATFTVSGVTGNATMNGAYTVRFIFANDAITNGVRGDVLIKDSGLPSGQGGSNDGAFKWVSISTGVLSTTRPSDPVTMNSSVTNYVNPFGSSGGNQSIPVIYAPVFPASGSGVFSTTESELRVAGKTYSFKFDPTNFIMFPTMQHSDINMIFSLTELMRKIHLGGLPHSQQSYGVGNPAATLLTVTQ